ncbi:signal-induced proliferation-associated 1-like protein 1-like [Planoprotostelium fungivorum]|uniref:Signal-induced proliferation-associated 1-like protein 1-like n=1 Tax=Planoprotostelium fungivorum TaxID=1890364 RepID=A0A2P6N392_9EUKA|nr:signal-induced proliferation-associated 1-like protein 1-like [Planoprotostelium fungivorum]
MYACHLHRLVADGNWFEAEKLLKKDRYDINCEDEESGQTPLHVAADHGRFDIVYQLLTRGANVDSRDKQEWTPLHCSAKGTTPEHLTTSSLLVTRGANPNAVNINHATPIHYIIRRPYSEELIEVLSLMIEKGAILDLRNALGESPLMNAVSACLTESVRFLIDHGADVNARSNRNRTPLHYAVERGPEARDIVLLLLKNGADKHAKATEAANSTPVEIALHTASAEINQLLSQDSWDFDSTYSDFSLNEEESSDEEEHYTFVTATPSVTDSPRLAESKSHFGSRPRRASIVPFKRHHSDRFVVKSMEIIDENSKSEEPISPPVLSGSASRVLAWSPSASTENNILGHFNGFYEEYGTNNPSGDRNLLFQPQNYKNWFFHSEHTNFVGKMNRRGSTERFEPLIVSVTYDILHHRYRMILFSRLGDKQVFLDPPKGDRDKLKSINFRKGLPKEFTQVMKEKIYTDRPKDVGVVDLNISLELVTTDLSQKLLDFETYDPLRAKCFSIGVLLSKEGQLLEDEQFNNEYASPAFEEFLTFLGERIPMKNWLGYRGDLDTKMNATGERSLYRRWKGFEIMFHVSTLLPYTPGVAQQLGRKRRIGNDIVVIIFQEGGVYTPPIRSQFLHTYLIVSPALTQEGKPGYRLQAASAVGVPHFAPQIQKGVYEKNADFREFLLTKVINSQLASLLHPQLREKIWCKPKEAYLVRIIKEVARKKEHSTLVEPDSFT